MTAVLRRFTIPCHDCRVEFTVERAQLSQCPKRCPKCRETRKAEYWKTEATAREGRLEYSEEFVALLREIREYVEHGYTLLRGLRTSCNEWARDNGLPEYRPAPLWGMSAPHEKV
jgi:hypothetical protein